MLFLDQAPEFGREALEALRQPLGAGQVVIARAGMQVTFPARFTLVLAASPCPCLPAASRTGPEHRCSPAARRRYLARLSGLLPGQAAVKVALQQAGHDDMAAGRAPGEPSAAVAQRVAAARDRSASRLAGTPWRLNADIPGTQLRRSFSPAPRALRPLERAVELGQVSACGADAIIRVAWTLADLAARNRPGPDEISQAIRLCLGAAP